jgi:formate dehydrogenase major subunit
MGVNKDNKEIEKAIENKTLKGLMIFGEDVDSTQLDNLEFLVVQDLYLTPTAQKADVVLPAVSWAESEGTFTNSERRIQKISSAITPLSEKTNWEIMNNLTVALGEQKPFASVEGIIEELSKATPAYKGAYLANNGSIWPIGEPDVLYMDGFATEDKKANLLIVEEGKMFEPRRTTDFVEKEFEKIVETL